MAEIEPHSISAERIKSLSELEFGWGGDRNSDPPTDAALTVLRCLAAVPRFNGGLQIEWHCNGDDIEIVIGPDGAIEDVGWSKEARK